MGAERSGPRVGREPGPAGEAAPRRSGGARVGAGLARGVRGCRARSAGGEARPGRSRRSFGAAGRCPGPSPRGRGRPGAASWLRAGPGAPRERSVPFGPAVCPAGSAGANPPPAPAVLLIPYTKSREHSAAPPGSATFSDTHH